MVHEVTQNTMKIVKCDCKHEFQDSLYGVGYRAKNSTKDGKLKCTVCNKKS